MSTSKVSVTEGTGKNVSTYSYTGEDSITKEVQRVALNNSSGTEIGTSGNPVQVSLANTGSNTTAVKVDGSAVTQPVSFPSGVSSKTQDGSGNSITSHSASSSRGIDVSIIDGSGNQITSFGGGTQYADGASAATPTGNQINWNSSGTQKSVSTSQPLPSQLRNSSGTEIGTASTPIQVSVANTGSNSTAIKVDGSSVTQPVSGTVTASLSSSTNAGATAKTTDYDTGAGTDTVTMFGMALPASGGAVAGGTATNPIQVSLANTGSNSTAVAVDTELPAAAAIADGATNAPTTTTIAAIPMIQNGGSAVDRVRATQHGFNSGGTGITASGMVAEFDNSSPTSISEDQFGNLRISSNRNLYVTIRDAAGNERGLNVSSAGAIATTTDINQLGNSGSNITANGQSVTLNNAGSAYGTAVILITGTWVGTLEFEGSVDQTTYVSLNAMPFPSGAFVTNTTGNGSWQLNVNGLRSIRVRSSAWTSGTATITLNEMLSGGMFALSASLPTGTNTIGALTANQSVNVAQINGVTTTMGNGVSGTGVQRITIASDSTGNIATIGTSVTPGTAAGNLGKAEDVAHASGDTGVAVWAVRDDTIGATSGTEGDYEAFHTNEDGALWVEESPSTKGGWSIANFTSGDSFTALTNSAQVIKASAGKFGGYYIYNPNTTTSYVIVYDVAAASVTVGTTNPKLVFAIPAGQAANIEISKGIAFGTAMSCAATTTGGGNSAPTTALEAMIWYK